MCAPDERAEPDLSDERLLDALSEWVAAGCPDEFPVGRGED
jgi:hypothetical protein